MTDSYSLIQQSRTAIAAPNAWTAVTIPQGAQDGILGMEDPTVTWRWSTDNTLNAASEGQPMPTGGKLTLNGTNTAAITLYVATPAAPHTAILDYQRDPT